MIDLIFQMFGGPKKFDCWLTNLADQMAGAGPARVDLPGLPPDILACMDRPREVCDLLLDKLDALGGWDYDRDPAGRLVDRVWGHVLEEGPA